MRNHIKFEEWAQKVYENKDISYSRTYFDKGDSDPRSLFECILESVDLSLTEHLNESDFDFNLIDSVMINGILESFETENSESINEVSNFMKKVISNTIDKSKDLINKGIQIGEDLYKSVAEIGNKLTKVITKVIEKVKELLRITWEWSKKQGNIAISKVKQFVKEEAKGIAVSTLASILSNKSAEAEFNEAPKDINGAVSKISGKTYNVNSDKAAEELKDFTSNLEDAKEDEIDDLVISNLVEVSESTVQYMFTSLKGLIIEGYSLDEVHNFIFDEINENTHDKKGLLGWLIEAIGFVLSPFSKLTEIAIKGGSNGLMLIVSAIARGGVKNAYRYVVMGTIVSLTYHIIHGMTSVATHFGEHDNEIDVKIGDTERLIDPEDIAPSLATLGSVFFAASKFFLPQLALIMEIVITSIASFELMIAFCEFSHKDNSVCKVIMKAEHYMEAAFKK